MTHICSEPNCQHELDTYIDGDVTIGTCRNPDCRLFNVTKAVDALNNMPEEDRAEWGEGNDRRRKEREEQERKTAERMSKIPAHLRTIG